MKLSLSARLHFVQEHFHVVLFGNHSFHVYSSIRKWRFYQFGIKPKRVVLFRFLRFSNESILLRRIIDGNKLRRLWNFISSVCWHWPLRPLLLLPSFRSFRSFLRSHRPRSFTLMVTLDVEGYMMFVFFWFGGWFWTIFLIWKRGLKLIVGLLLFLSLSPSFPLLFRRPLFGLPLLRLARGWEIFSLQTLLW